MPTSAGHQAAWQPVPKGQARENIPRVLVKVLVETNGCASRAEIKQSSGYPSLDNYAVRGMSLRLAFTVGFWPRAFCPARATARPMPCG